MATRPRILRPVIDPDDRDDVVEIDTRAPIDPAFDEALYLRAFPDIAEAVRRGSLASGLAHFQLAGRLEGRLEKTEYRSLVEASANPVAPQVAVDALTMSTSGTTLMTGWSDDRGDRLTEITLETRPDVRHHWTAFPRLARSDVARTLELTSNHRLGYLLVAAPVGGTAAPLIDARAANLPVFRFASGIETQIRRDPVVASDADLRDLALAALPTAAAGETDPKVIFGILDQHVGVQLAAINRLISEQTRARRMVERMGPSLGRFRGSVFTTLRGTADQLVPWLAITAGGPGATDYEFIITVTDPEQFEPALRAAKIAGATTGVALTLVLQPGGDPADIGGGTEAARSDRLIFIDQSVLPRDPGWAARHSALLADAPPAQTRLMGGMLYHPDGSLSSAGYYFDQETTVLPRGQNTPGRITTVRLNKATRPVRPMARPVIGVPGVFLSIDRGWFEALGGFTRHYSRAVHEDVDLCLRSLKRGVPAWIHSLPMWHFTRRPPFRPEPSRGGAILNDWLLHRQWDPMIVPALLGLDATLPGSENQTP
jgi:hypothetical protein